MEKSHELSVETLALMAILTNLCTHISRLSPEHAGAVRSVFEDATNYVEHITIKLGTKAPAAHTLRAFNSRPIRSCASVNMRSAVTQSSRWIAASAPSALRTTSRASKFIPMVAMAARSQMKIGCGPYC